MVLTMVKVLCSPQSSGCCPDGPYGSVRFRVIRNRIVGMRMLLSLRRCSRQSVRQSSSRTMCHFPERQLTFGQAEQLFSDDEAEKELAIKAAAEVFHKDGEFVAM